MRCKDIDVTEEGILPQHLQPHKASDISLSLLVQVGLPIVEEMQTLLTIRVATRDRCDEEGILSQHLQ
jgi:hypothetical protein